MNSKNQNKISSGAIAHREKREYRDPAVNKEIKMTSSKRIRWVDHSRYSDGYVGKVRMFGITESSHSKKFFLDCIVLTIYEPGNSYKTLNNAKAAAERVLDRFLKNTGLEIGKEEKIDE